MEWSKEDDGLGRRWFGRVFINPPFGRQIVRHIAHGVNEHLAGRTEAQVWLVPARCDTGWWHAFVLQADAVCTVRNRTRFRGVKDQAPFPIAFVYYGPDREGFRRRFAHRGDVRYPTAKDRLKARGLARMFGLMSQSPPKDLAHLLGLLTIAWDLAKDLTLEELLMLVQEARSNSRMLEVPPSILTDADVDPDVNAEDPHDAPPPIVPEKPKAKPKAKKKAPPKKGGSRGAAGQRPDHVKVLDEKVSACVKEKGEVQFADVRMAVPDSYNNQQIRRSLVRLTKGGQIKAEGNTRNRVYVAGA